MINFLKQFLHQNDPWNFSVLINMGVLSSSPSLHIQDEGVSLKWVMKEVLIIELILDF